MCTLILGGVSLIKYMCPYPRIENGIPFIWVKNQILLGFFFWQDIFFFVTFYY
jgi:hypothetical protein